MCVSRRTNAARRVLLPAVADSSSCRAGQRVATAMKTANQSAASGCEAGVEASECGEVGLPPFYAETLFREMALGVDIGASWDDRLQGLRMR